MNESQNSHPGAAEIGQPTDERQVYSAMERVQNVMDSNRMIRDRIYTTTQLQESSYVNEGPPMTGQNSIGARMSQMQSNGRDNNQISVNVDHELNERGGILSNNQAPSQVNVQM